MVLKHCHLVFYAQKFNKMFNKIIFDKLMTKDHVRETCRKHFTNDHKQ